MAIDLTALLNKIENKGETPQGKLSAEEFNTLVAAVRENQGSVRSVSYNSGVKIRPDENGNVDLIITESNYILRLKTTVDGVAPYKVALGNNYNMTVEISNKYLDGDQQVSVSTACTATFYCNDLIVNTQEVYDGDVVPYGKYFTDCVIEVRDKILTDSTFGLEVPYKTETLSETSVLNNALNTITEERGSAWKAIYYPTFSYAYAFRPTSRTDLLDRFKEHKWWLPTLGDMLRIGYYWQVYYGASGLDSSLNIFKPAVDKGLLAVPNSNTYYNCATETNVLTSTWVVKPRPSTVGKMELTSQPKTTSLPSVAICDF